MKGIADIANGTNRPIRAGVARRAVAAMVAAAAWLFGGAAWGQSVTTMESGAELVVGLSGCGWGVIVDDGGADGQYSNNFDGSVTLVWTPGMVLTLTGDYNLEYSYDRLAVSGASVSEELTGIGTLDLTTTDGQLELRFHTDGSVTRDGFALTWTLDGTDSCAHTAHDLVWAATGGGLQLDWSGDAGRYVVMVDGAVHDTTDQPSLLLSDIGAAQAYRVSVFPTDAASQCCAATATVRTACGRVAMPFAESFEDVEVGTVPPCWLMTANFDEATMRPRVVGTAASDGVRSLMLSCGSTSQGGHFAVVATPPFAGTGHHTLAMDVMASHAGTVLVVGTMAEDAAEYDTSSLVRLQSFTLGNEGEWQTLTFEWDAEAEGLRLAFMMKQSEQGGTGRMVWLDAGRVADCGVGSLAAERVTDTLVQLGWQTWGDPVCRLGVRRTGGLADEWVVDSVASPYEVGGLDPLTHYTFTVYPQCEGTGGAASVVHVLTDQAPQSADGYCSDFANHYNQWTMHIGNTSCASYSISASGLHYYRGCGYGPHDSLTFISPRLAGLAGRVVTVAVEAQTYGGLLIGGTVGEQDDTTSFVPIDTLHLVSADGEVRWRTFGFSFTVPEGSAAHCVALRLTNPGWATDATIRGVSVGQHAQPLAHVAHAYGTSAEVRWEGAADSVVVEYGPGGFALGDGVRDTVVGATRAVVDGLGPYGGYEVVVYRVGDEPCGDYRVYVETQGADHPMPLCEDFAARTSAEGGDWHTLDVNNGTPAIVQHPYFYEAGNALALSSYGFDYGYYASEVLPDMRIDSGAMLSFYASSTAPQSKLVIGMYTRGYGDVFTPIDTITIDAQRTHYVVPLDDSVSDMEGRLMLRWFHEYQYTLQYLYIDELQLDTMAYGNLLTLDVGADTATLGMDTLYHADSVMVSIAGGSIDTSVVWTPASGVLGIGGLDSGTLYLVHVAMMGDSGASCLSYPGYFITWSTGGWGMAECTTFDEYLSYELPAWWTFADTAWVDDGVLRFHGMALPTPVEYPEGTTVGLRKFDFDTLLIGYTTDSVGFTPTDTVTATAAVVRIGTMPDTARLALWAKDTVRLDMFGIFGCPIVDFDGTGGVITCTMRDEGGVDYLLEVQALGGSDSRSYRVTENPFVVRNLQLGTTYEVRYQCMNHLTECAPTFMVPVADNLAMPYCEQFGQVPQGWTFFYDDDVDPRIDYGTGEMWLGEWYRPRQMAVMPPLTTTGAVNVRVRCQTWGEGTFVLGTVDATMDTSTFEPLATNGVSGWSDVVVSIDSIGDRRVAMMGHSLVVLRGVEIRTQPLMRLRMLASHTAQVEGEGAGDTLWVHYSDQYGYDSIFSPDTLPYRLEMPDYIAWTNLLQVDGPDGSNCLSENVTFWAVTPVEVPFCSMTDLDAYSFGKYGDISDYTYQGLQCYSYYSGYSGTGHSYVVLPEPADVDVSTLHVGFSLHSDVLGDTVEVGVMTDRLDTSTFVPVGVAVYTAALGGWQLKDVDLAPYSGDGRWVAVRHRNSNPYGYYADITEFTLSQCAGMAIAAKATATLSSWNTVTVDAAVGGFIVEYGPKDFAPGSGEGTMVAVDTVPFVLALDGNTGYDIYFRCDSNTLSCRPVTQVGTLGAPVAVPVCFDFDADTLDGMPASWRRTATAGVGEGGHSGEQSLVMELGGYSGYQYVVSPELDVDTLANYAIGLWLKNAECSTVEVGTMSAPNNYGSFVSLYSCTPGEEWGYHVVSLADAPLSARYVAIRASSCSWSTSNLYIDDLSIGGCAAYNLRARDVNFDNITLDWVQVGQPTMTVTVVEDSVVVRTIYPVTPPLTVYGLSPHSRYTFRFTASCAEAGACIENYADSATLITPAEGTDCVNPTDLESPSSVFFTGSYYNPYQTAGVVDYGADNALSRHTVCYDTAARDERTGGQLRMVPEGYTSSVRLGNWHANSYSPEAEGVIYSLFVDTASFQLLLLRYAAVLQNPMHAPEDQPRFRMELLDSAFNPIDPDCSSADFVADRSLGWNTAADGVLWKDWTSVGIDLTDYADQQVYVRLTTYDCNEGSHYGYAYFTLECMRKAMSTEACGDQATNTLTAPAGFNYRWYTSQSAATLATTQSITIPTSDMTYYCDLSKVDNAECHFTISAYGGTRYPMASFDTAVTVDNCIFHVVFTNTSGVSKDNQNPIEGEVCETAYWDYGNGQTSTAYNGAATYMMPGTYTVMLVSGIADDQCQDTAWMTLELTVPDGMQPMDTTVGEICDGQTYAFRGNNYAQGGTYHVATPNAGACDSIHTLLLTVWPGAVSDTAAEACERFTWRGGTYNQSGTYSVATGVQNIHGCDSTRELHLTIHHAGSTVIDDTVVQGDLPYPVGGTTVSMANFDTTGNPDHVGLHWVMHTQTEHGCDSTIDFTITVWLDRDTTLYATTCRNTLPYVFNGTPLSPTGDAAQYTFHLPTTHGADSTVVLNLTVVDNPEVSYADTVVENDLPHTFRGISFDGEADTTMVLASAACDTLAHYTLHVWPNSDTMLVRTACRNELPLQFDSALFEPHDDIDPTESYADTITITMHDSHGADSTVSYVLIVGGVHEISDTIVICPGQAYAYHGIDYGGPTVVDVMLHTVADCDSLVHVCLVPRDTAYRPATYYHFDGTPWQRADSVMLGCSATTLHLWDTTPGAVARHWLVATADTVVGSTDSIFAFGFPTSHNPTPATATLVIEADNGCADTNSWPVLVFRSPKADFRWEPEVPVMSHPEAQFINLSTLDSARWSADSTYPLTYLWTIGSPVGDSDTSTAKDPYHVWGEGSEGITGDADVSLVAYWLHTFTGITVGPYDTVFASMFKLDTVQMTCTDTAKRTVVITNDYLQFPNLVTPNGDGTNDTWVIVNLVEYGEYPTNELWIYNQWGALVYHVRNIRTADQMWDPAATNSPDGTYYYRFSAQGRFGIVKRNGLIEVMR